MAMTIDDAPDWFVSLVVRLRVRDRDIERALQLPRRELRKWAAVRRLRWKLGRKRRAMAARIERLDGADLGGAMRPPPGAEPGGTAGTSK